MPVGGASTLPELDAITVTKLAPPMFLLPFLCMPSSIGSLTPYMFSQDDNTPCILLNDQLVDVAKVVLVKPKDRIMHGKQMPDGVLRVTMSRSLPGHEDMVPPYQPNEEESPNMVLGECKGWLMMWPKSQIRLDLAAPQITPFGPTDPIHGKTTTPVPPYVLGQS